MNKFAQDNKVVKYYCNMTEVVSTISLLQKKFKDEFKKNSDLDLVCGGRSDRDMPKNTRYYMAVWYDSANTKHVEQLNWIIENVETC